MWSATSLIVARTAGFDSCHFRTPSRTPSPSTPCRSRSCSRTSPRASVQSSTACDAYPGTNVTIITPPFAFSPSSTSSGAFRP